MEDFFTNSSMKGNILFLVSLILTWIIGIAVYSFASQSYVYVEKSSFDGKAAFSLYPQSVNSVEGYAQEGNIFMSSNEDPQIVFEAPANAVASTLVEFGRPVYVESRIQVFYAEKDQGFSEENSVAASLPIGCSEAMLDLPGGAYAYLRYDIDIFGEEFELKNVYTAGVPIQKAVLPQQSENNWIFFAAIALNACTILLWVFRAKIKALWDPAMSHMPIDFSKLLIGVCFALGIACIIPGVFADSPPIILDVVPARVDASLINEKDIGSKNNGLIRLELDKPPTEPYEVYVDGQKPSGVVQKGLGLSFKLPNEVLSEGEKEIKIVTSFNGWGSFYRKQSNIAKIEVTLSAPVPFIEGAAMTRLSDIEGRIDVYGENFIDTSCVYMDDVIQGPMAKIDETHLTIRVNLVACGLNSTLKLQVRDSQTANLMSNLYELENTEMLRVDTPVKFNNEYLRHGNLVAHALGGWEGQADTNSKEAYLFNYQRGHRIFEVDLMFSADGVLYTQHVGEPEIVGFEKQKGKYPYTLMDFEELCQLLMECPDTYIVTDTKYASGDIAALKKQFDAMSDAVERLDQSLYERIIVQFYDRPMYYFLVNYYKFTALIYTLYASTDSNQQVLEFVENNMVSAVTMPYGRQSYEFVEALNNMGVKSFVHTLNDVGIAENLLSLGAYGIYTDFIIYEDLGLERDAYFNIFTKKDKENMPILASTVAKRTYNEPDGAGVYKFVLVSVTDDDEGNAFLGGFQQLMPQDTALKSEGLSIGKTYLAVLGHEGMLHEELSNYAFEYRWKDEELDVSITADPEASGVKPKFALKGHEFPVIENAINLITLDEQCAVITADAYSVMQNGRWRKGGLWDVGGVNNELILEANASALMDYLDFLNEINDGERIIVIAAQDEVSGINETMQAQLKNLGLKEDLQEKFRHSYAAIVNGGDVLFEEIAYPNQVVANEECDGVTIKIISAGYDAEGGANVSIKINEREYAQNVRGLHVVVYDKALGLVVESESFDTIDMFNRKQILPAG